MQNKNAEDGAFWRKDWSETKIFMQIIDKYITNERLSQHTDTGTR